MLIQSLHADFTHEHLPYTMWTEPQYKEVTDPDGPRPDGDGAGQEDGGAGALTWAQLEPTSLLSVGAAEPPGLALAVAVEEEYEPCRGEAEEAMRAPAQCREPGAAGAPGGGLDPAAKGAANSKTKDVDSM